MMPLLNVRKKEEMCNLQGRKNDIKGDLRQPLLSMILFFSVIAVPFMPFTHLEVNINQTSKRHESLSHS
jgi:hypothetical protein